MQLIRRIARLTPTLVLTVLLGLGLMAGLPETPDWTTAVVNVGRLAPEDPPGPGGTSRMPVHRPWITEHG